MELSPRQAQILTLIAEGCQDKIIAQRLGVSVRTVDSHLQRLYQRYHVHSRAAIVAKWLREGGLPADDSVDIDR
ncbi:response regulator transcription factor [Saccharothrix saharensis]|uniref:response regulator transcription factor n=1 Tax=Saccharothrix saharensis TaxID=571190 RepID=UPI0036C131A7